MFIYMISQVYGAMEDINWRRTRIHAVKSSFVYVEIYGYTLLEGLLLSFQTQPQQAQITNNKISSLYLHLNRWQV